jgi:hypothetical protein
LLLVLVSAHLSTPANVRRIRCIGKDLGRPWNSEIIPEDENPVLETYLHGLLADILGKLASEREPNQAQIDVKEAKKRYSAELCVQYSVIYHVLSQFLP